MKAGISIDKYKLPVFSKRLVEAGFKYQESGHLSKDALLLTVECKDSERQKLAQVVLAANKESAKK